MQSPPTPQQPIFVVQPPPTPPTAIRVVPEAANNTASVTFAIPGRSTVPSYAESGQTTHKVSISVIDLQPQIEWVALPKIISSVFIRCRVKNTSPYIILPGEASVFKDGDFVSKSFLSVVNPQETFSTSLGVDAAIRVTYHSQQKSIKSSSGSILTSRSEVTSISQRISVTNNHSTAVAPLYIRDQVPASENIDIKVVVIEPRDLGAPKEQREVRVASGVKARWATRSIEDDDSGVVSPVEEGGVVEWICEVGVGKTVDVSLQWDVVGQERHRWISR